MVLVIVASISFVVDPPQPAAPSVPATPGEPQQGVIDDARRRQRSRRRRVAVVLIGLFAAGATVAGVVEGGGSAGSSQRATRAARIAALRAQLGETSGNVKLSPALEGGEYGWCVHLGNGASCASLPTTDTPLQGSVAFSVGNAHTESFITLLAPHVAGVLLDGQRLHVVVERSYPAMHLRVAKVILPLPSRAPGGGEERELALTAVDARGRVIDRRPARELQRRSGRATWWQRPHPIPNGPCQIDAPGIPGLLPQWGFVAHAIRPYPGTVIGRAFYSCISVEYYLHNWPLIAAVLLDAQHPGRAPGPIPEMKPLPGSPGVFTAPGDGGFHGEETALRSHDRWLVLAGGSGLAQRLYVLKHLRATVRLPARRA
jgi:hypothetical protein